MGKSPGDEVDVIACAKEKDALNETLSNCINSTNVHLRNYCTKIFVIVVNNVSVGALLIIKQLLAVILTSRGGGGSGALKGLQFSKRLDFGGSILKMHKM